MEDDGNITSEKDQCEYCLYVDLPNELEQNEEITEQMARERVNDFQFVDYPNYILPLGYSRYKAIIKKYPVSQEIVLSNQDTAEQKHVLICIQKENFSLELDFLKQNLTCRERFNFEAAYNGLYLCNDKHGFYWHIVARLKQNKAKPSRHICIIN